MATIRGVGSDPNKSWFSSKAMGNKPSVIPSEVEETLALPCGINIERCFNFAQHDTMKIRFLAFVLAFAATPLFAQQTPQSIADAELPSLITIYKDLHTHPELSGHEERSSAIVAKELKAAGYDVTDHVGKYDNPRWTGFGIIGVMKNGDGPVVEVRTDLAGR